MLARPVSCPSVREQRAGPKFSATAPSAPVRARAPPSAASVICCRCLAQLAILFLRGQFFLLGRALSPRPYAHVWLGRVVFSWFLSSDFYSPRPYAHVWPGRIACFARFCAEKWYHSSPVYLYTGRSNSLFCTFFAWHDICLVLAWCCMALLDCAWHVVHPPNLRSVFLPVRLPYV